jgi:hypothetical protein
MVRVSLIILIVFSITGSVFSQAPGFANSCFRKIAVGSGPEDMVLDEVSDPVQPRLIISCSSRRKSEQALSEISSYDIRSHVARSLRRIEPADLCLHPHGIDLVKVGDSLILLVVNHCDDRNQQSIVRYLVKGEELHFINQITDPLFRSPNAVAGLVDGSFLVSNDAYNRGSKWEMIFRVKKAQVIFCKKGQCSVAAKHVCFGNGIMIDKDTVYQASTIPGEIYRYIWKDGILADRTTLAKVKGVDNIRGYGDKLIVAGHLKFGKFIRHMKHKEKLSPSNIYAVSRSTGAVQLLYSNEGDQISAASTGIVYNGHLYIGQVFDSFILDVDMSCLKK